MRFWFCNTIFIKLFFIIILFFIYKMTLKKAKKIKSQTGDNESNLVFGAGTEPTTSRSWIVTLNHWANRYFSSVHDVKATILGPEKHRFKAEIDFDGRNITRAYLDDIDMDEMLGVWV